MFLSYDEVEEARLTVRDQAYEPLPDFEWGELSKIRRLAARRSRRKSCPCNCEQGKAIWIWIQTEPDPHFQKEYMKMMHLHMQVRHRTSA
jgi:hypothetical protein